MAAEAAATVPLKGSKLTLAFPGGLVNVPVALKPLAETQRPVPGKGMCPVHGATLNAPGYSDCCRGTADEHQLPNEEKLTGYPHPDDPKRFVVVDPTVVKSLKEPKSGQAAVEKFVDVAEIDPGYLSKAYVVWPQPGGEQAFDLLAAVLREEGKAAVITTVLSQQTQTVLLRWCEQFDVVLAHVVEFESRLRRADVHVVAQAAALREAPSEQMLEMARNLFGSLDDQFDAADVVDRITPAMQDAIRAADEGKAYVVPEAVEQAPPKGDDLAALLAASAATATAAKPKPKRKAAPRKKAAA